ncbi:pantoate--beta-alanine ligase [Parabacteroides sp. PF5-5]|uniref:pantoate--beta-alanine ligase n=1 Tax=unclassified Parabacteroides TaxID=2649774 RepID=UPI002476B266|nr:MULTISPECIES: pantoate--beta-alanine ligase [unclassified Parabacteroides]MDH6305608.1 pantoate--beta-alanine ligase [Parabacteroides sp. PH5-39]MDH6316354.1 pantoate--beta-alanine ligase [Parabacteroides sp. PF5-13]MDH6319837.1 pantoate--beta-alanine ligase [Parabacteroides sp. PH5-13]MDH6323572.1 pantoate--beta-alanine ligase [Parabacteroides sp. PH5-8]MDH6327541.1 pantoate--beta-alanine ligase [Parabacteroides sp. PH5-41]
MKIIDSIQELKDCLSLERQMGKRIGLVPTMGALHNGHISLVERCAKDNDISIASIFVNPTQFNDKKDLATYPRTPEKDHALLQAAGCDYVFAPSEKEMYPEPDTRQFQLGRVAEVMEGAHRPGHFNGVAQIVSKLFYIVEPDNAYFGEKDFQQVAVIRAMVRELNLPVNIITCPIIREADGLAMSSRNTRLTPAQRQKAPLIARTLKESTNFVPRKSVQEVMDYVIRTINSEPVLEVEYFDIVDGNTLESIQNWNETSNPVGCIAVFCGEVRLIDNITYTN